MVRVKDIELNEQIVTVFFDYQPEEKQTRDYPGCGEEIEVNKVYYEGKNIYSVLSDSMIEEIEELISKD